MGRARQRVDASREILFNSALEDLQTGKIGSIRAAAKRNDTQYETLRDRKRGSVHQVNQQKIFYLVYCIHIFLYPLVIPSLPIPPV